MYRATEGVDAVWLLIGATLMPLSSSFNVPVDVVNWSFDTTFDKVLLFSGDAGKVFDLRIESAR